MSTVKLAPDCFVPYENILFCCALKSKTITDSIRRLRKEGKVFDCTLGKKMASVVFLKGDGGVILSPTSIETINSRCKNNRD